MRKTRVPSATNLLLSFAILLTSFILSPSVQAQNAAQNSTQDTPKLSWSGDLRYRFVNLREATDETRLYQQLRARLGLKAEIQDDLNAVIRLATATSAISNNQTLGDAKEPGMPRRAFGLDLAYGDWRFLKSDFGNAKLWLGRTPNPFFAPGKTQMIFDSDLAFEGASLHSRYDINEQSIFATLGGFIISENFAAPEDAVDTGLVGLELGYVAKTTLGQFTARAARFHYLNIIDRPVSSVEKDAKVDPYSYPYDRVRGNTVYPNDPLAAPADRKYFYKYDFVQTALGAEWKFKFEAVEFLLYGDYIVNDRAADTGEAIEYGASVKYGRAQLLIADATKKSDSVVGAFTDSDMNGGGTDNSGIKVSASYQLSDYSNVVFTHFQAKRGIDSVERDYKAQQLDFSLQF